MRLTHSIEAKYLDMRESEVGALRESYRSLSQRAATAELSFARAELRLIRVERKLARARGEVRRLRARLAVLEASATPLPAPRKLRSVR